MTHTETTPLVRFIAPAYPNPNIFSNSKIVPSGLVSVATAANKLWRFRVEIIDENNYHGPRDKNGLPDHAQLQKENPSAVMGMYCGLTSTMDRVYELLSFYREQGVFCIAGGWHAHYCPKEVIERGFDVVVHGDGEIAIRDILFAWKNGHPLTNISGISYRSKGGITRNPPDALELPDLNILPYPDFGLLRHARKIRTYPIGRVRGCRMNCEFCSVKGNPRWSSPRHMFDVVNWLVETRHARNFFIVDDRLEENPEELMEFFRLIQGKYGNRLNFTVQMRIESAKNTALLEAMKRAGVRTVCVGLESPLDEDLKAMHKGLTSRHMVEWVRILRKYFWVHGMFIFGYPNAHKSELSVQERIARYKKFIRESRLSSIQVLHPVPIVGTELRARLLREGRIFPLDVVPWSRYEGSFACFEPSDMSLKEFQEAPLQIMKWFYSPLSFLSIPVRTLLFPLHYLVAGWHHWHYGWLREIVRYGGHRIIRQWHARQDNKQFHTKLEEHANRRILCRQAVSS